MTLLTPSIRGRLARATGWMAGAAALAPLLLGGCAMQPPTPWDKGLLAKPEMTMASDPLEQRYSAHIYTSKEAASGGTGVGGGGCGCN